MDRPSRRGSLATVDDHLREIDRALEALCARVTALEHPDHASPEEPPVLSPVVPRDAGGEGALPLLTLTGRTLVVLGGAFLLRAVTDSGRLPVGGGIMVGLAYASTWIGAADRAAARRPASALFHGLAAIAIGFPLLFEASVRFGALSPEGAALLLVALTAAVLAVSWHRSLPGLAGVAAVTGSLTAITLAVTTGRAQPFALAAIAIGCVASAMSVHRHWRLPAWPPFLVASLLVLAVAIRAQAPAPLESLATAAVTALLLALLYLAVAIVMLMMKRRDPEPVDLARGAIALAIGAGGGFAVAGRMSPAVAGAFGFAVMLAGVAGYGLAVTRTSRWPHGTAAYLSSISIAALVAGAVFALDGPLRDISLAIVAIALIRLGESSRRSWSSVQGVMVGVACALTSGLIGFSVDAWTAAPAASFMSPSAVLALGVLVYGSWLRDRGHAGRATLWFVTELPSLAITVTGIGAVGVFLLNAVDGQPATAGAIAAERSAVLALLAICVAWFSRVRHDSRLKWLGYALLMTGGIKLAIEDLSVSSPLAIFIAFGAYGIALIASARILSIAGRDWSA